MTSSAREAVPEVVLDSHALLGEGPVWDDRTGTLLWVDILRGEIHWTDVETGSDRFVRTGELVGAVALRRSAGLVVAAGRRFARCDEGEGELVRLSPDVSDDPMVRMNDGKCDAAGRFWAGTMTIDRRPGAASLYRLDPDGRVKTALAEVTLSNGTAWSPDDATCYYVDTPLRRIDGFDFDVETGTLSRRHPVVELEEGAGNPDGLTVDAEGFLWVAMARGGAVRRYAPDGRLDRVVRFPVTTVTSCAFGGRRLDRLFVTTACVGRSERELYEQPFSGALFACDVGVSGLPSARFAG